MKPLHALVAVTLLVAAGAADAQRHHSRHRPPPNHWNNSGWNNNWNNNHWNNDGHNRRDAQRAGVVTGVVAGGVAGSAERQRADQRHADAFAHEMDLIFGMHVPDVALPRVIVEPPQKTLARIGDDVLDDRRLGGFLGRRALHGAPSRAKYATVRRLPQPISFDKASVTGPRKRGSAPRSSPNTSRNDASAGAEAMLSCLALVTSRLPRNATIKYLSSRDEQALLNWDAEHYRQQMTENR